MTTYVSPLGDRVTEFDQEGNVVTVPHRAVRLDPIGEATQRLFPIARDTDDTPRSAFAVVDPATTATLPALAGLAVELGRRAELRTARISAERASGPGRHREPGLFARLFGRGRKDGV